MRARVTSCSVIEIQNPCDLGVVSNRDYNSLSDLSRARSCQKKHQKPRRPWTRALIHEHAEVKGGWELPDGGRSRKEGRRQQISSMNSTNDKQILHEGERYGVFRRSDHTGRCRAAYWDR